MKYIVFGKGKCGEFVRKELLKRKHQVIQIETGSFIKKEWLELPVIVGVFNAKDSYLKIKKSLNRKGFPLVISFEEFYRNFNVRKPYFWLDDGGFDLKNFHKIYEKLADEKSKLVFKGIVAHRLRFQFGCLVDPDKNQYFPEDVPIEWNSIKVAVDGGAYNGDTAKKFQKRGIKAITFEPNPNYKQEFVYALSDKEELIPFNIDGQSSSCGKGSMKVKAFPLDKFDLKPDYIKLDVEGYEKKALLGAKKTILKYRPVLAVALYHKPNDIYDIPLLLMSWGATGLYVRNHGEHCLETILYVLWR